MTLRSQRGVLAGYFIFFACLFIQWPLAGALPGNCDTWLAISLSNTWANEAMGLLGLAADTGAMHPAGSLLPYGESAPASGLLFCFWHLLTRSELWAIYLTLTSFFALSAFGVQALARTLGMRAVAAVFAGFAFACSNFAFANVDDSIVIFWLLPCLSLRSAILYLETGDRRRAFEAPLLLAVQIYFSIYVFLIGAAALLATLAVHPGALRRRRIQPLLAAGMAAVLVVAPYIAFYLHARGTLGSSNPFDYSGVTLSCSVTLTDMFRALPGNLVRPTAMGADDIFWVEVRRLAFLGFGVWIAGLGAFAMRKGRRLRASLLVVGLLLSFVPVTGDATNPYLSLPAMLQEFVPLAMYYRVPLRAWFLVSMALALGAGLVLDRVISLVRERYSERASFLVPMCVVFAFAVHAAENIPAPMPAYDIGHYITPPPPLMQLAEDSPEAVVMHLPSDLGLDFLDSGEPVFRYSRELIYQTWQTQHRLNILNGANGYFPPERLALQQQIGSIVWGAPGSSATVRRSYDWDAILAGFDFTHVVSVPALAHGNERLMMRGLSDEDCLELVGGSDDVQIYRVRAECRPGVVE